MHQYDTVRLEADYRLSEIVRFKGTFDYQALADSFDASVPVDQYIFNALDQMVHNLKPTLVQSITSTTVYENYEEACQRLNEVSSRPFALSSTLYDFYRDVMFLSVCLKLRVNRARSKTMLSKLYKRLCITNRLLILCLCKLDEGFNAKCLSQGIFNNIEF